MAIPSNEELEHYAKAEVQEIFEAIAEKFERMVEEVENSEDSFVVILRAVALSGELVRRASGTYNKQQALLKMLQSQR